MTFKNDVREGSEDLGTLRAIPLLILADLCQQGDLTVDLLHQLLAKVLVCNIFRQLNVSIGDQRIKLLGVSIRISYGLYHFVVDDLTESDLS